MTQRATHRDRKSLSWVTTFWASVAIGVAMAVYAAAQFVLTPEAEAEPLHLVATHAWHVFALGAVIYGFCWLALHRSVLQPMRRLRGHLYGIGTGELRRIDSDTGVIEIDDLIDGANLMVDRMRYAKANVAKKMRPHVEAVAAIARELVSVDPGRARRLLEETTALDALAMAHSPSDPPASARALGHAAAREHAPRAEPRRSATGEARCLPEHDSGTGSVTTGAPA